MTDTPDIKRKRMTHCVCIDLITGKVRSSSYVWKKTERFDIPRLFVNGTSPENAERVAKLFRDAILQVEKQLEDEG